MTYSMQGLITFFDLRILTQKITPKFT